MLKIASFCWCSDVNISSDCLWPTQNVYDVFDNGKLEVSILRNRRGGRMVCDEKTL